MAKNGNRPEPAPEPPEPPAVPPAGDPQEEIRRRTRSVGINLVLVSQYELRDEDGFLLHTEQRQDAVTGPSTLDRVQAAMTIVRAAEALRRQFLASADDARLRAALQAADQEPVAAEREG